MLYKSISWIIKKDDFKKNAIISQNFTLMPEDKSILFGKVNLDNNSPAIGFGVVLEEVDKTTNSRKDKCFTFTNDYGNYYLAFTPLDNKIYNIVIYRNLTLN